MMITIGITALQGDISEHIDAIYRAMEKRGVNGRVVKVRTGDLIPDLDGLVIPGGESTTITRLMLSTGIADALLRHKDDIAIWGTCAGAIALCEYVIGRDEWMRLVRKEGSDDRAITALHRHAICIDERVRSLGIMSAAIVRNYYGNQKDSFETMLRIEGMNTHFPGIFIRAPAIIHTWNTCRPLSVLGNITVMAVQDRMMITTFHPELVEDSRVHNIFLDMILEK